MISKILRGKSIMDCKNVAALNINTMRGLLAEIPVWEYGIHKKEFRDAGGVEYVVNIGCYFIARHYAPKGGELTADGKSLLRDWLSDEISDTVKSVAAHALQDTRSIKNMQGRTPTISDLYAIASHFGFSASNFLSVYDFVYFRPKSKFMSVHNVANLYPPKTIQTDCLPVLVNEHADLWMDADEFGMESLFVDDVLFDPCIPSGRNMNVTCEGGALVPATGHALLNTYTPPICKKGPFDEKDPEHYIKPFIEHLKLMLPHEGDAKIFLQWCAHVIQKPGEKVRWSPILYSLDQGVGKDSVINFIQGIIGKKYCSTIKASDLSGNFNEWAQSIIIRISEVSDVSEKYSRKKFQEEVKALISGDDAFVTINEKYGIKHNARNIARVIITTNNPQDIAVSEEDRRYDVFECATKEDMGIDNVDDYTTYFDTLHNWYNQGGRECLYTFLSKVDISDFNPNRPRQTKAKVFMQTQSMDYIAWINDTIEAIAHSQPRLKDTIIRADTFIAVARVMAQTDMSWTGPESSKIPAALRANITKFKYSLLAGPKGDGRCTVGNGKKTNIYIRGYNTGNFMEDKFDLLKPEQAQSAVNKFMGRELPNEYSTSVIRPYKMY